MRTMLAVLVLLGCVKHDESATVLEAVAQPRLSQGLWTGTWSYAGSQQKQDLTVHINFQFANFDWFTSSRLWSVAPPNAWFLSTTTFTGYRVTLDGWSYNGGIFNTVLDGHLSASQDRLRGQWNCYEVIGGVSVWRHKGFFEVRR